MFISTEMRGTGSELGIRRSGRGRRRGARGRDLVPYTKYNVKDHFKTKQESKSGIFSGGFFFSFSIFQR